MSYDIRFGYTGVTSGGTAQQGTATRVATVLCSDATQELLPFPLVGEDGTTIPSAGEGHPEQPWLLSGVPVATKKGPGYWEVKIPYTTPDFSTGPAGNINPSNDPLQEPAVISWDTSSRSVNYDVDIDGKPCVNTMNEPFSPPLSKEVKDPIFVLERNETFFDPQDLLTYIDTVCVGNFRGARAGRARLTKLSASVRYGRVAYWRKRYEVAFRYSTPAKLNGVNFKDADAWKRLVLNQGTKFMEYDPNDSGTVYDTPSGKVVALSKDSERADGAGVAFHWLAFAEYPMRSWSRLAIG